MSNFGNPREREQERERRMEEWERSSSSPSTKIDERWTWEIIEGEIRAQASRCIVSRFWVWYSSSALKIESALFPQALHSIYRLLYTNPSILHPLHITPGITRTYERSEWDRRVWGSIVVIPLLETESFPILRNHSPLSLLPWICFSSSLPSTKVPMKSWIETLTKKCSTYSLYPCTKSFTIVQTKPCSLFYHKRSFVLLKKNYCSLFYADLLKKFSKFYIISFIK